VVCGTQTVTVLLAKSISRRHHTSRGLRWKVQFRGEVSRSIRKILQLPAAYPGPGAGHEHHILAHFGKFDEAIAADTKARMLTGENENSARRKETALLP